MKGVQKFELHDGLEQALSSALSAVPECDIRGMLKYAVFPAGKRVRPGILFSLVRALGGTISEDVLRVGVAVELFHCASLVHDDLPAVDDDAMRRGQASFHVKYGEGNAVLAGDLLYAMAFQEIAKIQNREVQGHVLPFLAGANTEIQRGQLLDISNVKTSSALFEVHRLKTAALFRATCLSAYYCGDRQGVTLLELKAFGEALGLVFQALNDLEDEEQTEEYARAAGSDVQSGRGSVKNFHESKQQEHLTQALAQLQHTYEVIRDNRAEYLGDFTGFQSFVEPYLRVFDTIQ